MAEERAEKTADQEQRDMTMEKKELLDKWLCPLKEDLTSWISRLLAIDISVETFASVLDTGVVLCRLANFIQTTGEEFFVNNPTCERTGLFPASGVTYKQKGAFHGSFVARDNVANFIRWCRELRVPEVIMFETEDLVLSKNEKAVLLTLLEVARKAFKFGVEPPELVRLENEIDKELEEEPEPAVEPTETKVTEVRLLKKKHKSHSLDDLVFEVLEKCSCPTKYPVHRISDGKYKMGDSKNLIFVRVMRKHVMVRVGGGWDTLDRYFAKHDPCRMIDTRQHRPSKSSRPHANSQSQEPFVRSPSSISMASVSSSTDSHDSSGTVYSHMSICSTPQMSRTYEDSRSRTLSGGTGGLPYGRCLSPPSSSRGSQNRTKKSPANRSTPPRTIETLGRQSRKSKSMQDLHHGFSSTAPVEIPISKPRPSSAKRATSATTFERSSHPKSAPGTPSQRRKSVAVTQRRDSSATSQVQSCRGKPATPRSTPPWTTSTQGKLHNRSRSMQDLNGHSRSSPVEIPISTSRSRPSSARARPSSATPERPSKSEGARRQSIATTPRRSSTTPVNSPKTPRRSSNALPFDSPRGRNSIPVSPDNSPRRPSSASRASTNSPANSPRVYRKQSGFAVDGQRGVRTPGTPVEGRRTKKGTTSAPPQDSSAMLTRSASFGSRPSSAPLVLKRETSRGESPRRVKGTPERSSPQENLSSPATSPTKQSRIPLVIPGKKPSPKRSSSPLSKPHPIKQEDYSQQVAQNGYKKYNEGFQGEDDDLIRTPFDDLTYTSEDTASVISEGVSENEHVPFGHVPLTMNSPELNLNFSGNFRPSRQSGSGESTPVQSHTANSSIDVGTGRDFDFLDVESELKSPRSLSSEFSRDSSPSKELWELRDQATPSPQALTDREKRAAELEGTGNVGIMQRLKNLNVQVSSINPTLRGRIFTPNETDGLEAREIFLRTPSPRVPPSKSKELFSFAEYKKKDPEERSKFFDIEKESLGFDVSQNIQSDSSHGSPRKFSLVQSLIGSIEKMKNSDPQVPGLKKSVRVGGYAEIGQRGDNDKPTVPHSGDEVVAGSHEDAQDLGIASHTDSSMENGIIISDVLPPANAVSDVGLNDSSNKRKRNVEQVDENYNDITEDGNSQQESAENESPRSSERTLSPGSQVLDVQIEHEELKLFEEDEKLVVVHEAVYQENGREERVEDEAPNASGNRKTKAELPTRDIDVYPRPQRQFTLEEMIEDMLPGDSTNKDKADAHVGSFDPHFQAWI